MSKPCNSCDCSTKLKSGSGGESFFICEKLDCRMSNADYVKICKHKRPKKFNRKKQK